MAKSKSIVASAVPEDVVATLSYEALACVSSYPQQALANTLGGNGTSSVTQIFRRPTSDKP